MKIICCTKAVPDTASHIRIRAESSVIDSEGLTFVINPYDEYAVEEALRIKERLGQGEITAVSLGDARAKDILRTALSMGVDRAIHLVDSLFDGLDSQGIARVLARAISNLEFDLILCGKQAVDMDSAQVGPALAEILDLPQVGAVIKLELESPWKTLRAHRQVEGGVEIIETPLPCVITAQKGLNEPRYPSLKGILASKKKEIVQWGASQLQWCKDGDDLMPARTSIISLKNPPLRVPGRLLEGEVQEKAKELVRLLREEAKVI